MNAPSPASARTRAKTSPAAAGDPKSLGAAPPPRAMLAPPAGMRDLLPPEAAERRALVRRISERFTSFGYALVTTPPFEHAEVIERAEGSFDPRDHLRFVDADTGEVALLRPDITPQIARVVATRLGDRPPPYRLAYEGHVVRRRRGRARRQRQIAQVGLECIGIAGTAGDAEVIELLCLSVKDAGLTSFVLELALVPLVRAELDAVPEAGRADATEALARKDRASLKNALRGAPSRTRATLLAAIDLSGDAQRVLGEASRVFSSPSSRAALQSLAGLVSALEELGLGPHLRLDLGEVRGFGYYTGASFSLLAPGPGEPLGGGGRYDTLLGRFGRDLPATGFALDVDHLGWALAAAGRSSADVGSRSVAVSGAAAGVLVASLRADGFSVSVLDTTRADALVWATAWGARFVVHAGPRAFDIVDRARGIERVSASAAEVQKWIRSQATGMVKALGVERGST